VLWDADGVLQNTPRHAWDLAVQVVEQFPGAMTGTPIDEELIRAVADELGLSDHTDEILKVWSTFDLSGSSLEVVAQVRATGTACYLATNQDVYRAACMREKTCYSEVLDGAYYSCDIGVAKPSVAFFEYVIADLGLQPGQMLFLDDQPNNVAGARAAGLHAERWTHQDGLTRLRDILHAHGVELNELAQSSPLQREQPPGRLFAQPDNVASHTAEHQTGPRWKSSAQSVDPAMKVIRLLAHDAGEVLTLQRAAYITEAQAHADLGLPPLRQSLPELIGELDDPQVVALGRRDTRGRLVAAVRARVSRPSGTVADIGRLTVVPDQQGQGLGSGLLEALEGQLPPDVVELRMFTGEHSVDNLRLYTRLGYTETHREPTPAGYYLVHLSKQRR
jgi:HAD superfamily hydrolase (TIGR01509 family)